MVRFVGIVVMMEICCITKVVCYAGLATITAIFGFGCCPGKNFSYQGARLNLLKHRDSLYVDVRTTCFDLTATHVNKHHVLFQNDFPRLSFKDPSMKNKSPTMVLNEMKSTIIVNVPFRH